MAKRKNKQRQYSGELVRAVGIQMSEHMDGLGRLHELVIMDLPVEIVEQYQVRVQSGDTLPSVVARATDELEKVWR